MKVEVLKYPTEEDWILCKKCTLTTVSKDSDKPPTDEWKVKLLKANHSPIRTLQFCFKLTDIPYWVSVHLVRHVHATPFVSTQRGDRQDKYDRESARQDAPVTMCWYMNAEELITIAHKRLCNQASPETRTVVSLICDQVLLTNPEFKDLLVPNCVYRGGICDEFNSCGYNKSLKTNLNTWRPLSDHPTDRQPKVLTGTNYSLRYYDIYTYIPEYEKWISIDGSWKIDNDEDTYMKYWQDIIPPEDI